MTNRYKIYYKILSSGEFAPKIVESPLFEYPNTICINEHINLPFPNSRVSSIKHNIDRGCACLDVEGIISSEENLEKKLEEAKIIFAKLNKSENK